MSDGKTIPPYHEESSRFRDALTRTAAETGFSPRLIEKDYFCSLFLLDLNFLFDRVLVFKGGTCLSKVHLEFFRMSEDLDFVIPVPSHSSRTNKREAMRPVKSHLSEITKRLPFLNVSAPLDGQNQSTQYSARFNYNSAVSGLSETILFEVSLREELIHPAVLLPARTLLLEPFLGTPVISPFPVRSLSLFEALAEKTRAALTRRIPAIRDFFDLDTAHKRGVLPHRSPEFSRLVKKKLLATTDPVDLSPLKQEELARQIETQLKPVLRPLDFENFDLERVVAILNELLSSLSSLQ